MSLFLTIMVRNGVKLSVVRLSVATPKILIKTNERIDSRRPAAMAKYKRLLSTNSFPFS